MDPDTLRVRRARLGMTQAGLGAVLGVPTNTVMKWERGHQPVRHPRMLALALDALDARVAGYRRAAEAESAGGAPLTTVGAQPTAAAVLRVVRELGIDQDEAVRLLGGTP